MLYYPGGDFENVVMERQRRRRFVCKLINKWVSKKYHEYV